MFGGHQKIEKVALGLGSNLGDRMENLRGAVRALAPYVTVTATSPVYETAPVYVGGQPAFLNAAVTGTTGLPPLALLRALKDLEAELGRMPTFRYGPRAIDIDIIFYGDEVLATPELTLPHPRLQEREFVLRPLTDIAPGWRHPANGLTVAEMLARVPSSNPSCLGSL
ncbi:MAG TPA: 2-amino-4-hydroxy-6-hydroxymethyldihydropteridine diphosphokinase [Alphaproteobacteria bacterium]|nr:2-amino-4-hydroxy-6-hydroxymethyldihydropteridine diphosphokinase [Alphaproteobacteria bacterium]